MVKVIGPRDPRESGAINTTSRATGWLRGLSPFFLGPVDLWGGHVSRNMENAWQFSKVYPWHVNDDGDPSEKWWEWVKKGWSDDYAHRYPAGKDAKPLYSYWDGEKLDYPQARRKIYIPLYANAVQSTDAFRRLKMIYAMEGDITLWDFDAYDHRVLGMDWEGVIDCTSRKCGHGFVLAMLLEDILSDLCRV
jgi:hypothetical protein